MSTNDHPESAPPAGDSRTILRAGPLTLEYRCGMVGRVRWNGRLVLLGIYGAVRDRDWLAVPARISEVDRTIHDDSFRIVFDAVHYHEDVNFVWRGSIVGSAEGSISFEFDGTARTAFLRNRIGLCLLHPVECAGASCRVEHVDGTASEASLPELPAPRQPVEPFTGMRAMSHVFEDLGRVTFRFEGEAFELEDHRNWTDASFKTFSTPLELPAPVTIPAGTRVMQRVTASVRPTWAPAAMPAPVPVSAGLATGPAPIRIVVGDGGVVRPLPELGLGLAAHTPEPLGGRAADLLRPLRTRWLRVDVRVDRDGWEERFDRAVAAASQLGGVQIEAALFFSDGHGQVEAGRLRDWLAARPEAPPIGRILALPAWERPRMLHDPGHLFACARAALPDGIDAAITVGSNSDFNFVNRVGPVPAAADGVVFAINPQVHASDSGSMVETLPVQAMVVGAARRLVTPQQAVIVSPVTLRPRWNPYQIVPGDPDAPPEVDFRQQSLFAACWTLGSLKYLGESGANSVTFYETHGDNGILSANGEFVYPIWFVLHAVYGAHWNWRGIIASRSSDPHSVDCLALADESGRRRRIVLANLTAFPQTVRGVSGALRLLDEASEVAAATDPDAFWSTPPTTATSDGLTLPPHALAIVDWEVPGAPNPDDPDGRM